MKILTKIILCCFLFSISEYTLAQQASGKSISQKGVSSTKPRKNSDAIRLYLGGGISTPNSGVKTSASLSNFTDLNLGAYIPIKSFGKWSFGIEGSANYGFNNELICPASEPFQIMGQSGSPVVTQKGAGSPEQQGFRVGAGPAFSWSLSDKFSLMPSVNVLYNSFKETKCTVSQASQVNGINYNWDLCDQTTKASSGIGVLPKLKLIYQLGRIGLWIEGNYLMAQKLETTTTTFVPEGNVNQNGMYNLGQMNAGTYVTKNKSKNYSAFGILGGISIGLGSEKGNSDASFITNDLNQSPDSDVANLKETNQGASLLGGALGGNKNITPEQPAQKGITEKGIKKNEIQKVSAQACSCTSLNDYAIEYPSTGNVQAGNILHTMSLPLTAISSGNNIHLYFPKSPCISTVNSPCYGNYQVVINGNTFNSNGTGVNQHIQIPTSVLVAGSNTMTVKGICGPVNARTICSLPSTTINVINQSIATITLTPECCTSISGPQHTSTYTGKVRFKMTGTASPGTKLKISSANSTDVITTFVADDGSGIGFTGCFKSPITIVVLDALGNVMSNATVNGQTWNGSYHYKYVKSFKTCVNWDKKNLPKPTTDIKAF